MFANANGRRAEVFGAASKVQGVSEKIAYGSRMESEWAYDDENNDRPETFDTHVVMWSVGLTQFPDQALAPNHLAVLDLRYNKICTFMINARK